MTTQMLKAKKQINNLTLLLSEMLMQANKYPANSPMHQAATQIAAQVNSDKAIQAFLSKCASPGYEALAGELAIRVITKAKSYEAQIKSAISNMKLSRAVGVNKTLSGRGFGFAGWFDADPLPRELGLSLLRSYYDNSKTYGRIPESSFEAFLSNAESKVPDFATNVGELVQMNSYSTDEDDARSRLIDLAIKSEGTATLSQIISAAGGSGDTINYSMAIPTVLEDTAASAVQQGGEILQNVGTGVVSTLNFAKYLPWILLGAGALYIYVIANKHGAGVSALAKTAKDRISGKA